MVRLRLHNVVHAYIHNGVRFHCFLDLPRSDESRLLLSGGMQTERRGRIKREGWRCRECDILLKRKPSSRLSDKVVCQRCVEGKYMACTDSCVETTGALFHFPQHYWQNWKLLIWFCAFRWSIKLTVEILYISELCEIRWCPAIINASARCLVAKCWVSEANVFSAA